MHHCLDSYIFGLALSVDPCHLCSVIYFSNCHIYTLSLVIVCDLQSWQANSYAWSLLTQLQMLTVTKQLYDLAVTCAPRADEEVLGPLPELIVDGFDDDQVCGACILGVCRC